MPRASLARQLLAALSILFMLGSVLFLEAASGQTTGQAAGSAPGAPGAAPATPPSADLQQQAALLQRKISRLRGLRARRAVPVRVVRREVILELLKQTLTAHRSDEEFAGEGAILQHLGLLPPTQDYQATVLALLEEQVTGMYDAKSRQILLADDLPPAAREPTLAHELCHALQDQHFNLRRWQPLKGNSDQQLARSALVEGDCLGVLLELMLAPQDLGATSAGLEDLFRSALQRGASPALKAAPPFLRDRLLFPYHKGLAFIQQLRARSSWSTINRSYRQLPETTEQVLHAEKYSSREKPAAISARPLPLLGELRQLKQDVLGEFQLRLLLGQTIHQEVAERAAAGWDGDRLVVYSPRGAQGPLLSIHLTRWDSDLDAREFANALRRSWAVSDLSSQQCAAPSCWAYEDPLQRRWLVQLYERQVLALRGVPPELSEPLRRQVWERWRIDGRPVAAP